MRSDDLNVAVEDTRSGFLNNHQIEFGNALITRRRFCAIAGTALASFALCAACRRGETAGADDGRLTARPPEKIETSIIGETALGLDHKRDAILKLPTKLPSGPLPLVVLFHGAGQSAEWMLEQLGGYADGAGVAVLAPNSRGVTWDALSDSFGRDVRFVNNALERVFDAVKVDPARISVCGFSDGATYAISFGLINGDLFSRVVAFSPGFVIERTPHGTPKFLISHGTADPILPIDRCGRRVVRELKERGYEVTFREFDGGHEIPDELARDAMQWLALPGGQA